MPRARKPYWADHLPRRPHGPAARRGAAAFLAASALAGATVFAVSPLPFELGLVALTCDQPKAMRQLAAARETRSDTRALLSELRVSGRSDSRAQELSRQIAGLGFIPAQHTGWRQKAVDVSDQLHGTTDPKMRAVALTLARHGYGPTPADLLDDPPPPPGPGGGLGHALGQGSGSALGSAVNGAAQAADGLAQPPATGGDKQGKQPQRKKKRQTEPPLPKTCAGTGSVPTGSDRDPVAPDPVPDKAAGSTAATPRTTATPSSPEVSPSSIPPSPGAGDPPDNQSEAAPPASPTTSAAQPPKTGGGTSDGPDKTTNPEQARAAIQLLGELMQALGANGEQDSTRLRDLLDQAMQSGQPQLQPPSDQPDTANGGTGSSGTGSSGTGSSGTGSGRTGSGGQGSGSGSGEKNSSSQQNSGSGSGSSTQDSGQGSTGQGSTGQGSGTGSGAGEGEARGWGPSADKLAKQVSQAADSDPLAEQLADKLRAAGIEVPEAGGGSSGGSGADQSGQEAGSGGSSSGGSGSTGGKQNGSSQQNSGSGSGGSNQDSGEHGSSGQGSSGQGHSKQGGSGGGSGSGAGGSGSNGAGSGAGQDGPSQQQSDGSEGDKSGQQSEGPAGAGAGQEPKDPTGGDGGGVEGERARATTWDRLAECPVDRTTGWWARVSSALDQWLGVAVSAPEQGRVEAADERAGSAGPGDGEVGPRGCH